jgi:hypothetical protein
MANTAVVEHTLTIGGVALSVSETLSEEGLQSVDISVATATTDQEVAVQIHNTEAEYVMVSSDKNVSMQTNDGAAPDDTIAIVAGKPLVWRKGAGIPFPFAGAVTALFFTNVSGATAAIKIRVLGGATP